MNPMQRVKSVLMACSFGASIALPWPAFAKGLCPPMMRELPLKIEHKDGQGGGGLVSYPQKGDNGPRYDTPITTMGLFWAGARLMAIDLKNVVSSHHENILIIQAFVNPNRKHFEERFRIGEQTAKSIHFDLKHPLLFTKQGMDADLFAREGSEDYTLSYRGVVLHIDISNWFCMIPF